VTDSRSARFLTTRWSVVLAAGGDAREPGVRDALETLAGQAWFPLYAYLRRRGESPEDAADLVQGLLARLLERGDLARLSPERGRFRSYLLTALDHYLANERERARARKRGGDRRVLSLDLETAEERLGLEPADGRTPELAFEALWARELLDRVLLELESEFERRGKVEVFRALLPCLGGAADALPYTEVARTLDSTEGAVKVAVHRLRTRYRELLRREIAETLPAPVLPGDVEDELRQLFRALGPEDAPKKTGDPK